MEKSSSLGMPMHHPKKYPRSTSVKAWGCPRGTPSSSAKIRSPFKTLYFYCFMHYMFFLERRLFLVFNFVCCNKWLDPNKFLLEKLPCFSFAKNTPFFTLFVSTSVLFFLELRLAFDFCLDLPSDLVISFHQGVFLPLIFIGFHQKRCL
jgi:hypothetical protein